MVDYVDLEGREYLHYQEWFKTEREDKRMKRYLLFGGRYYDGEIGGIENLVGDFDELRDAYTKISEDLLDWLDWFAILDTESGIAHKHYSINSDFINQFANE